MDKKIKIYLICAISSFSILVILFLLGIIEGISIKGRIIERILLLTFIVSPILGLIRSITKKNKKARRIFFWILFTPLLFTIIFTFLSPLASMHYSILIIVNTLNNEKVVYESESFKIVPGYSIMTNDAYDIKTEYYIFEKVEAKFQTEIKFENSIITYDKNYVFIDNKGTIDTIKISN